MTNPDGGGIPARHAGKEHTLAVRVRAGLSGDDLRGDLRLGAGAALNGFLEHIHDEIRSRGLEDLMAILLLVHIHDDIAVAVQNTGEGERLLIDTLIGDGSEGDSHLHGRDAGRTERQTEGVSVDVLIRNAHQVQIFDRAGNADIGHQNLRRSGVVAVPKGTAEALRAFITAAAVVLGPGILAAGILPAGNRNRHVVGNRSRGSAQVDGGRIDRQRLDGGADGHGHAAGAIKRLSGGRLITAADDGFQFAGAVIEYTGGCLRLLNLGIGAVRIAGLIDLIGRSRRRG